MATKWTDDRIFMLLDLAGEAGPDAAIDQINDDIINSLVVLGILQFVGGKKVDLPALLAAIREATPPPSVFEAIVVGYAKEWVDQKKGERDDG